ncbi:hypothetical protein ACHQM5_002722 [Ranunculus cassubicifolius]
MTVKELEEALTEHIHEVADLSAKVSTTQSELTEVKSTLSRLEQRMIDLATEFDSIIQHKAAASTVGESTPSQLGTKPGQFTEVNGTPSPDAHKSTTLPLVNHMAPGTSMNLYKIPKVDFPPFTGTNVRSWILKTRRYFQFHSVEENQKILFASLHFQGKAEAWFQSAQQSCAQMQWEQFVSVLQARFSDEACENIIGEFNKLQQTSTVDEYQNRFEELKSLMLQKNPHLTAEYFIMSFISGLKDDIRHMVQMFRPASLAYAISLAKLQETQLDILSRTHKPMLKHTQSQYYSTFRNKNPASSSGNSI